MRIFDPDGKQVLSRVTLFLTPAEASELGNAASALAADPAIHHCHVLDASYETEITVAVHTDTNLHLFDSESRSVIEHGAITKHEA